jgi:hypothetical protein
MQFDIDMKSEHSLLFDSVRQILLKKHSLKEIKKNRITTYSDDRSGICHMRTMKHGIDIGFLKGVHMEDKYGLLTGSGKVMRVLSLSELNVTQVQYYVEQAIAENTIKK